MIGRSKLDLMRAFKDEEGQVLPWMVLLLILFLGGAGLCVDLGHAYICERELQASTDAAALAGGYALSLSTATSASVKSAAANYSSVSPGVNVNSGLPSTAITTTLKCLTTLSNEGIGCSSSPTGDNAIQVTQTAIIPTHFIRALRAFGVKSATSMTLSAISTASMRGATNAQYNVAVVIDTTASMGQNDSDASCNNSRITCALQGVQTLLQSLSPCTASSASSGCTGFDTVSLFTFPNMEANTASNDYTCPTSNPTIGPYSTPVPGASWSAPTGTAETYQITNYLDDYSSTNKSGGALNTSSYLAIASGVDATNNNKTNCSGLQTPGGDGTYFAGAIYAALSSLASAQAANTGSQNALIILSDGDASTTKMTATNGEKLTLTGAYPSLVDQCQQAVTAAKTAPTGTTVYSIAYGASSSGCSTDTSGITPCQTMEEMASSPADFYSDATASQNKGQCTSSSNPNLTLNGIFTQLATSFTVSRLIPNNTP